MKTFYSNIDIRKILIVIPLLYFLVFLIIPVAKLFLLISPQGNLLNDSFKIISDNLFWDVFLNTILISFQVAFLSLLIGFPIAYLILHSTTKLTRFFVGIVVASMWLSILIRSFAWIILLQKNGILNSFLFEIGLIEKPISLIYTRTSVIIGMIHILIPYAVFVIWGAVKNDIKIKRQIARSLGSSDSYYFLKVLLPIIMPSCLAAFLLIFLLSMGFYITPALLGGGNGDCMMISMLIEQQMNQIGNWQQGILLSVNLVVLSTLIILFIVIQPNIRNIFINLFNINK